MARNEFKGQIDSFAQIIYFFGTLPEYRTFLRSFFFVVLHPGFNGSKKNQEILQKNFAEIEIRFFFVKIIFKL